MIKLDDNLLAELGLHTLPSEEKKNLLRHIYETLELRVGTTLAQQMTDGQLDEFESFINNNDESGALHWLETNFPNYKDVVAREFEVLKDEVRQAAPQILASAQQNAQMSQQPQPMPQQGSMPVNGYPPQQQPANAYAGAPPQPQYPQPMYQQPVAPVYPQSGVQQPAYPSAQQPTAYQPQPMPPQYSQPQQPQTYAADNDVNDQSQYGQAA